MCVRDTVFFVELVATTRTVHKQTVPSRILFRDILALKSLCGAVDFYSVRELQEQARVQNGKSRRIAEFCPLNRD